MLNNINATFSLTRIHNGSEVPYVTDFCYGFNGTDTGWLQDPRPRPFYCSAARILQLDRDNPATPTVDENHEYYGFDLTAYTGRLQGGSFQPFTLDDLVTRPQWQFIKINNAITVAFSDLYQHGGCQ
jgi:hypothetical protein